MLTADIALIGGTGIGGRLAGLGGQKVVVPTRFGPVRGTTFDHRGRRVISIQRHSSGHNTPPHLVNYRALAEMAILLKVRGVIASAAVGSIRAEWGVGTLAICTDFVDFSGRRLTMHERNVAHVDFSHPFPLHASLIDQAGQLAVAVQPLATYLCNDGPRYETPAEIQMMRGWGADVVGMTAGSEAICFHEAKVPYGCIALVTNLTAGLSDHALHHGEVAEAMECHGQSVVDLMLATAAVL